MADEGRISHVIFCFLGKFQPGPALFQASYMHTCEVSVQVVSLAMLSATNHSLELDNGFVWSPGVISSH